ncbi:MAG: AAA family ATPase [Oscillospiraceae bacterium]|jgi:uncharacterized protein YhaN|nr:AAA family ATPase [Oscillospiraceae bacterium]
MIIKRMTASFGKLKNETLTFSRGLNIVEAPNESGKSTWCAFLRAMLFGVATSERDRAGYLSDKTRFAPWSGAPMAGELDADTSDGAITIRRLTRGRVPMQEFAAVYTGAEERVPGISPANCGEILTGVTESVFRRTAFIAQSEVRTVHTAELEQRILALVGTGDESSSYAQTDERLRAWLRRRKYNKSGEIPALESRLEELTAQLNALERRNGEVATLRENVTRLERERERLTTQLAAHDARAAATARERRLLVKSQVASLSSRATWLDQRLSSAPTRAQIAEFRGELGALGAQTAARERDIQRYESAASEHESAQTARAASPLYGHDISALEAATRQLAKRRKLIPHIAVCLLAPLLTAALYFTTLWDAYGVPLLIAAYIVAAALLFGVRGLAKRGLRNKIAALLEPLGLPALDDLQREIERLPSLTDAVISAEITANAANAVVHQSNDALKIATAAITARIRAFIDCADAVQDGNAALDELEGRLDEQVKVQSMLEAARSVLEGLPDVAAATGDPPALDPNYGTRDEVAEALARTTARLTDATARCNVATGELRSLGDPAVLGSERLSIETRLDELRGQYSALEDAIAVLKSANHEMSQRFSPLLTSTAEQLVTKLTGGLYDRLTFTRDFDITARATGDAVPHNVLYLSTGAGDTMYLALRLALCRLVLPPDCPIVLDDTLASLDDERMGYALDCLKDLAAQRQIILFTCHGRESRYLANDASAKLLTLN